MKETIWFRVSCWGRQAEIASSYVKKGQKVLVEGRLVADPNGNPRIYTRQDGTPAASFEISATSLKMLSSRSENEGGYNNSYSQNNNTSAGTAYMGSDMGPGGNYDMDPDGDDIPF